MPYERIAQTDIATLAQAGASAPAGGGGSGTTSKVGVGNFTQGSSAQADITGLSFIAAANTLYEVDVMLVLQSNGGNISLLAAIQFSAAGASCGWTGIADNHATTKVMIGSNAIGSMGGTNLTNDGTKGSLTMKGWVQTGANAGNITVQISGGNNGSGTTVFAGSRMTVTPL